VKRASVSAIQDTLATIVDRTIVPTAALDMARAMRGNVCVIVLGLEQTATPSDVPTIALGVDRVYLVLVSAKSSIRRKIAV